MDLLVVGLHGNLHLLQVRGLHVGLQFARKPSSELTGQCQHSPGREEGRVPRTSEPGWEGKAELALGWLVASHRLPSRLTSHFPR